MSIKHFTADLQKYGLDFELDSNGVIKGEFEDKEYEIVIDEEWDSQIRKIYKSKQYETNPDLKYQLSNNKVEFQVVKLDTGYVDPTVKIEFTDSDSNKVS